MGIPIDDVVDPYDADAEEPQANNRREEKSDPVCAVVLQSEQAYQYRTCYGKQNICKSTWPNRNRYSET